MFTNLGKQRVTGCGQHGTTAKQSEKKCLIYFLHFYQMLQTFLSLAVPFLLIEFAKPLRHGNHLGPVPCGMTLRPSTDLELKKKPDSYFWRPAKMLLSSSALMYRV